MNNFDVIVIGGGPAGCYAALTAARRGCRVALFEEHQAIGWPRHDPGWLMASDFTDSLVRALEKVVPATLIGEYRVRAAESGDLIETASPGGYVVRRDSLEKELAASAVRAGVSLHIKTRVLKFLRQGETVEGVATNSAAMPVARARIFICADGIRSVSSGLALQEKMCEKSDLKSGLSLFLANADVSSGIIEHFISADPALNYKCFFTHHDGLCILGCQSAEAFYELKQRSDNAVSLKIQNAFPIEVSGYARGRSGKYGEYFKKIVRDNILFIGDASGGAGNIHGMIQGQFAGDVAAEAIHASDPGAAGLSAYQALVDGTLAKAPFSYFSAREDFGSFNAWFRAFEQATQGITAKELME